MSGLFAKFNICDKLICLLYNILKDRYTSNCKQENCPNSCCQKDQLAGVPLLDFEIDAIRKMGGGLLQEKTQNYLVLKY